MARKKIVIANWKNYPTTKRDALKLFGAAKKSAARARGVTTIICPPAIFLPLFSARGKILLGSQNVSGETTGAHTGELSASMLSPFRVTYVIVGHSERRALGEDEAVVAKKVRRALAEGIRPVLCIGEAKRDTQGAYHEFLRQEIRSALIGLSSAEVKRVLIAYEPIWAIGKSAADAMKPGEVHETVIFIRKTLTEIVDRSTTERVPILYGGSVELDNVVSLYTYGDVDGFLVGHASTDAKIFDEMLGSISNA
ncbi:triose-phosphate isomerase [Candidatus Kaiserbacteria bacterium RIFCSPHIGHO2_01_FULL_49_13]|uniref:Triosephosphate isomerase n=1 Tax=Candidatus Kaiserbacteria bacterium RIFCSPHIGHO2_01_FULL_49_13 TaxID=1798477 RepID=A0A1F6CFX6_9BACT|nr:MAG: triose-phosphate isomerase [Candidatus Kaiserbacteria bacterium RIFCSPHIGHO2_01_FULL_49_13]